MPYQLIKNRTLPDDAPAGGAPLLELEDSSIRLRAVANDHLYIETKQDSKNVRLNNRNYTRPTDTATAVQIKPNVSATGASSMVGLEVSPRFAAGVAGADLVAIKADPLLKAGAGNLSGGVVGCQANLDFGISGTRTITGNIAAFESFLAIPSTYTYSAAVSFLRVRNVNIKGWDYFLDVEGAGTGLAVVGATMVKDPNDDDEAGYLKIRVAGTYYQMAFWASS